jgi:predicted O-methyltransferase YrrM
MSPRTINLDDALYGYLLDVSLREPPLLAELRAETAAMPMAQMQISPEQGQFMALLVEALGVRKALEIGTFTGYSALWMALALPADGRLVCCDIDEGYAAVARRYWERAGVTGRIELKLAPAAETLRTLIAGGGGDSFDFAFIDADKKNYDAYYEGAMRLVRPGGLILIDNVLWSGAVADPSKTDPDTSAIRALNRKIRDDRRVAASLLPVGDGLMLVRRRM